MLVCVHSRDDVMGMFVATWAINIPCGHLVPRSFYTLLLLPWAMKVPAHVDMLGVTQGQI